MVLRVQLVLAGLLEFTLTLGSDSDSDSEQDLTGEAIEVEEQSIPFGFWSPTEPEEDDDEGA